MAPYQGYLTAESMSQIMRCCVISSCRFVELTGSQGTIAQSGREAYQVVSGCNPQLS